MKGLGLHLEACEDGKVVRVLLIYDLGFRDQGFGFQVSGFGFRVSGLGCRA